MRVVQPENLRLQEIRLQFRGAVQVAATSREEATFVEAVQRKHVGFGGQRQPGLACGVVSPGFDLLLRGVARGLTLVVNPERCGLFPGREVLDRAG